MPKRLETVISDALWTALHERAAASGQSVRHLVQEALADALDVAHHSLFQVSTAGALVEGLYQGAITVGDLRMHGDTGLGTFEELDGEMILIDGRCYQARSDGTVVEAPDDARTPFAAAVVFAPDATAAFEQVSSFADLTERLDGLRTSENEFVSWRITGAFELLRLRAACRHASGTPLVEAIADQAVFEYRDLEAAIVGFWSPEFAQSIAIPGYHLHAISADRTRGGHVFDLVADRLEVEVNLVSNLQVALPETEAFLRADLARDPGSDLDRAEREEH